MIQDPPLNWLNQTAGLSRTAVIPLMKMLRTARMAAMRKLRCSIDLCREGQVWAVPPTLSQNT
ncbi:MAG: hypothetical protein V3S24_01360, partial [Candidatus Tectomicrobia bacterium]